DFIFNSYTLLCFASGTSYYLYYGRDEALTEKRALKELEKGIFPLIDNELKFLIVNENKTRIVTWVYKKVFLLLIGLMHFE
ncbi:hypothetical protein, partial [Mycobacterium tuberculosis]|uniref:hypothetical protein n=1 Tax=Mycobacterium tuberculosis TaxID=1773 RepID=UPI001BE01EC5